MKKAILLSLLAGTAIATTYAHHAAKPHTAHAHNTATMIAMRGSAIGDTSTLSNVDGASPVNFTVTATTDSGFLYGTNAFGDKGFAERFDFSSHDSSVQVIGMGAFFTGTYNAATTKTINLKVWSVGPRTLLGGHVYSSGYPNTVLAQRNVSIKNLGINPAGTGDTIKFFSFTAPTPLISQSFFAGYDINYNFSALGGDTINLISSDDGERISDPLLFEGQDTILNVQNAVMFDDNSWNDDLFENSGISHNLFVFPIVVSRTPTSVPMLSKNELSFYGAYPNPAQNTANIKYVLNKDADVTVSVMDITGRLVQTVQQPKQFAGEHLASINTAVLPAGDYIYVLKTSRGSVIGSKLTVTH